MAAVNLCAVLGLMVSHFLLSLHVHLQAARLAVARVRPPLAACARVWELRQGPLGRLEPGGWASPYHIAAAAKERAFWDKVCVVVSVEQAAACCCSHPSDVAVFGTHVIVPIVTNSKLKTLCFLPALSHSLSRHSCRSQPAHICWRPHTFLVLPQLHAPAL